MKDEPSAAGLATGAPVAGDHMLDEPENCQSKRWRRADFTRAVIELALALGWEVRPMSRMARVRWTPGWPGVVVSDRANSILLLVRRHDRRLIFADLRSDGTCVGQPCDDGKRADRAFIDQVRALEWDDASTERARAQVAVGRPVPTVQTVVWRPKDMLNESIHQALR